MPSGYKYDLFISYRRQKVLDGWMGRVVDHLTLHLERNHGSVKPFFDRATLQVGDRFPTEIREGLLTSRCLVPFWSAQYFESSWCLAEWKSFVDREERTKARLVIPVGLGGLDYFPPEAKQIQHLDLSEHVFVTSTFSVALQRKLNQLATAIGRSISAGPDFDPGWPVIDPSSLTPKPLPSIPRPIMLGQITAA